MKKLIFLCLCLLPVLGFSQQTYWTTSPSGYATIPPLAFRFQAVTPDSLNNFLIFNTLTSRYNQFYTAAQSNLRFMQKSAFAGSFNNGLSADGSGRIGLGGTLSRSVIINDTLGYGVNIYSANPGSGNANFGGFYMSAVGVALGGQVGDPDIAVYTNNLVLGDDFSNNTASIYSQHVGTNDETRIDLGTIQDDGTLGPILIRDEISSIGMVYSTDNSTKGKLLDRWIPDWGAVKAYSAPIGGGTLTNSITGGVGVVPFSWNNTARDTINVDTTKIPLTITPNQFKGTDIDRIQAAVNLAALTSHVVHIPHYNNRNGGSVWLIDTAILLPSNITIYIDNCIIKLSNLSRDNWMRSDNVGFGITTPFTLRNIRIIGTGNAIFQGPDNPRSTGDSGKALTITPTTQVFSNFSYGTDAGVSGQTQTGDWRNIGILLAMVDTIEISNITIKKSNAWGISLERSNYLNIHDIYFDNADSSSYAGLGTTYVRNRDGIDILTGAHEGVISNIQGLTGDDSFAASMVNSTTITAGNYGQMPVTGYIFNPITDTIKNLTIQNIHTFSSGGGQVRILNTGPNLKVHDMSISNIVDVYTPRGYNPAGKHVIIIGDNNPVYGGATPLGNTSRIHINGITANNVTYGISLQGSLSESTISNVIVNTPSGIWDSFPTGSLGFRNTLVNNIFDSNGKILSASMTGTSAEQSLKSISNTLIITDSQSLTGLRAAADYSTNFNSLNYITRGFGDARYFNNIASQTKNTVLAAPVGGAGVPAFRALDRTDTQPIFGANTTTGTLDANDLTNNLPGFGPVMLRGSTASNMPNTSTSFWHPFNVEYLTKNGTGDITQFMFPYSNSSVSSGIFYRGKTAGTWGAYHHVVAVTDGSLTAGFFPVTNGSGDYTDTNILPSTTTVTTPAFSTTATTVVNNAYVYNNFASLTGVQTITNKTFTSPILNNISVAGQVWTASNTTGSGGWANPGVVNRSHTIFTPTTGTSVNVVNNQTNIINPSGALVALTIALPSSPSNNDKVDITFTQAVTTISYSGGTVVGGPTTIAATGQYYLTYDSASTSWY